MNAEGSNAPERGVERLAQAVADQVQGGDGREEQEPGARAPAARRGIEDVLESVGHQEAPGGGGLRRAEPEELKALSSRNGRATRSDRHQAGDRQLGSTCRKSVRQAELPSALLAST